MNTTAYLPYLEKVLTPKRLEHSLGAMQIMGELAGVYGMDREQWMTAGLLHDAAKDLSPARQEEIVRQANIEIRDVCDLDYGLYLHGPVGAYLVQQDLGVTDPLILDAIKMHTYYGQGNNFHAPISWCVRFSDVLEPTRNWSNVAWLRNGVSRLRETVYAGRLMEGAFLQTGWLINWFSEAGMLIHPGMRRAHQELSVRLNVDDSFLVSAPA